MAESVTELRKPVLPEKVIISSGYTPQFTPRELGMIRDQTGRAYSQIVADEDSDEKFTVTAWLKLRRDGYDIRLEEMADVVIELAAEQPPGPTSAGPSDSSSPSAGSGT